MIDLALLRNELWSLLSGVPDNQFKHGRTAAFYGILYSISKMIYSNQIKLNTDDWLTNQKKYEVIEIETSASSTKVKLTIKGDEGLISNIVVPENQIEWIYDSTSS